MKYFSQYTQLVKGKKIHSVSMRPKSYIPYIREIIHYTSFTVWLICYHDALKFHPYCSKWQDLLLSHNQIIFHCVYWMYVTFSLSLIHPWTLGWFHFFLLWQMLDMNHGHAVISLRELRHLLWTHTQKWDHCHILQFYLTVLRNLHTIVHSACTVPSAVHEGSVFYTFLPAFVTSCLFNRKQSNRCEVEICLPNVGPQARVSNIWCILSSLLLIEVNLAHCTPSCSVSPPEGIKSLSFPTQFHVDHSIFF